MGIALVGAALGEGAEQGLGDGLPVRGQLVEDLLGVVVQRPRQAAHLLECGQRQPSVRGAPVPEAHQGMLQQRELVHLAAGGIQQALHQVRLHPAAAESGGEPDGVGHLLRVQARGEVEPGVHRLRQPRVTGAVAEEVRAHGDDYIDRRVAGGGQEQLDEGLGVALAGGLSGGLGDAGEGVGVGEAEQLLELVGDDQQARPLGGRAQAEQPVDGHGSLAQVGLQGRGGVRVPFTMGTAPVGLLRQGLGERPDGLGAGAQLGDLPAGSGTGQEPGLQGRQQPGAH